MSPESFAFGVFVGAIISFFLMFIWLLELWQRIDEYKKQITAGVEIVAWFVVVPEGKELEKEFDLDEYEEIIKKGLAWLKENKHE